MKTKFILLVIVLFSLGSCTILGKKFKEKETKQQTPNYFEIVQQKEAEFAGMSDSLKWKGGSDSKNLKIFQDFWRTRVDEKGSFEPYLEMRKEKLEQQQVENSTRASGDTWRELGYIDIPSGTNPSNGGTASGGGPIEFIEIYEPSSNYILAGSTQGGLFQSTNYGTTWSNLGSDTKWSDSGCMWAQYHPTDNNTIFAISGMGSGNTPFWIGYTGGIMRTTNGGNSWEKIGNQQDFNWIFNKLSRFVINPNNPNEIYLATSYGLYKTTNALAPPNSVTWQKLNNIKGYVYDLKFMPNSNRLAITYAYDTNPNQKYYTRKLHQFRWVMSYTDNGGASWTNVNAIGMPDVNNTQWMTIETSKNAPNTLFTLHVKTSNQKGSLYKYDFTTNTWSTPSLVGSISHGEAHAFAVSDIDANKVAVGCSGINNGRYKFSKNRGASWNYHTNNWYDYHVDVEDFEFDPSTDELYMASHGGVYRASDINTYKNWVSKNTLLGVSTVTGFSISPTDPSIMLAGLYHGGTIITHNSLYAPGWQPQWKTIYWGDGGGNLITDSHIFVSYQTGMCRSNDLGVSYQRCVYTSSNLAQLSPSRTIGLVGWIMRPVKNRQTSTIYVQGEEHNASANHVLRSDDFGDNWEVISDISSFNTNTNLTSYVIWKIIPAPSNKDVLYIITTCSENGIDKHRIYKTINATAPANSVVWTEVAVPHDNIPNTDAEVDFDDAETIYVTKANDFGNNNQLVFELTPLTTTNITYNLSNINTVNLELIKNTNNEMYLLTDVGVYVKNNANNNWNLHGVGLPHVNRAADMKFDFNAAKIRLAEHGRGIWEISRTCSNIVDLIETGTYPSDAFKEVVNNITSTAIVPNGKTIKYLAGNQIMLNNNFQAQMGSEFQAVIIPCRD